MMAKVNSAKSDFICCTSCRKAGSKFHTLPTLIANGQTLIVFGALYKHQRLIFIIAIAMKNKGDFQVLVKWEWLQFYNRAQNKNAQLGTFSNV